MPQLLAKTNKQTKQKNKTKKYSKLNIILVTSIAFLLTFLTSFTKQQILQVFSDYLGNFHSIPLLIPAIKPGCLLPGPHHVINSHVQKYQKYNPNSAKKYKSQK